MSVKINNAVLHAVVLGVLGLIFLFAGGYIISVPGAPGRGSGIGSVLVILGLIMLVIAALRYSRGKRTK